MFGWFSWLFPALPKKASKGYTQAYPTLHEQVLRENLYPSLSFQQFGQSLRIDPAALSGAFHFQGLSAMPYDIISGWGYDARNRRVPTNKIETREVKCLYCGSRFVYNDVVAEYKTKKVLQEIKPLKCPNCAGEIDLSAK